MKKKKIDGYVNLPNGKIVGDIAYPDDELSPIHLLISIPDKETPQSVLDLAISLGGNAAPYIGEQDGVSYFQVYGTPTGSSVAFPMYPTIFLTYKDSKAEIYKPEPPISWEEYCQAFNITPIKE